MSNLSEYLTRPASHHPPYIAQGEKARLFPVLNDKSKEGRCTSIFLSCLSHVQEFGTQMLKSVGQSAGKRAKITTYTEVTLPHAPDERPDGLIVMKSGKREWKAFVESKVGNNKLKDEQISAYVQLAKKHNIDAVITISNQFTWNPEHHPVKLSTKVRKIGIYHWSWWYIVTQAYLLTSNKNIEDYDQHVILEEMLRFLEHESTGVQRFDSMPPEWKDVVRKVAHGSPLQEKSDDLDKIISSWHQEIQDIDLMLSCKINAKVKTKLSRHHAEDPKERIKDDIASLKDHHLLAATLEVPNAAALVELKANINTKVITASMTLKAPTDKSKNSARINWIQKQLQKSEEENDIYVDFHWKGRKPKTQVSLKILNEDFKNKYRSSKYEEDITNKQNQIVKFEVSMIRHLAGRFAQSKNFITDLENLVSDFHKNVVQNLKKYQPPVPRIQESNRASSPANVTSDEAHGTAQEEA